MRKILSVLISLVALSFMASCASDTPSETSQAESIGSEAAPTPDSGSSEQPTMPNEIAYDGVFPQHEPYGTGTGAMPGRVVWTHDPDSVEWDGEGYWWELAHFDELCSSQPAADDLQHGFGNCRADGANRFLPFVRGYRRIPGTFFLS